MSTVVTFLCLLGLSRLCSGYFNSYDEALASVESDKRSWGWGVSTLVIIHNE